MNKKVSFLADERDDNRDITFDELCDSSKNEFKSGCWQDKTSGLVIGAKITDGFFQINWMASNMKASDLIVIGHKLAQHGLDLIGD